VKKSSDIRTTRLKILEASVSIEKKKRKLKKKKKRKEMKENKIKN